MLSRVKCHTCGVEFEAKTYRNVFCKRSCFKKYYRQHEKQKTDEFPSFICPGCKAVVKLTFDPKRNRRMWLTYACSFCGYAVRGD